MKLNESIYGMYQRWNSGKKGTRKEDVHEYVDLGLPSGLMWATCNLGADTPIQFGDYYQWGGIEPMKTIEDCPYYDKDEDIYTKYNKEDGLTVLEPKDDAVHVAWGGKWRMPTKEDFEELIKNTNNKWVVDYLDSGVNGALFIAKNGNELFIPATGYFSSSTHNFRGSKTFLWSSSLHSDYYNAYYFHTYNGWAHINHSSRCYDGFGVRGVFKK